MTYHVLNLTIRSCHTCHTLGGAEVGQVGHFACLTTTPLGVWGVARQTSGAVSRWGNFMRLP